MSETYQPDDMGLEGVLEDSSSISNASDVRNEAEPEGAQVLMGAVSGHEQSSNVSNVSSKASTASQASASSPPASTIPGPSENLEDAMEVAHADSEEYHEISNVSNTSSEVDRPSDEHLDQLASNSMQPAAATGDDGTSLRQPAGEEIENADVLQMVDDLRELMTRVSNKTTALIDEVAEEVGNCTTALSDVLAQSTHHSAVPTLDVNLSDWALELSQRLAPVASKTRVEATALRAQTYESFDHRIRDLSAYGHSLAHKTWRNAVEVSRIMDKAASLAEHGTNDDRQTSWLSDFLWRSTAPTRHPSANQTELADDVAKVIADIADGNATLFKASDILSTAVHRAERLLDEVQEFASNTFEGVTGAIKLAEDTKEGESSTLDVLTTIHASSLTTDLSTALRRAAKALNMVDDADSAWRNKRFDAMMEAEREFLDSRYRLVSLELNGLFLASHRLLERIEQVRDADAPRTAVQTPDVNGVHPL